MVPKPKDFFKNSQDPVYFSRLSGFLWNRFHLVGEWFSQTISKPSASIATTVHDCASAMGNVDMTLQRFHTLEVLAVCFSCTKKHINTPHDYACTRVYHCITWTNKIIYVYLHPPGPTSNLPIVPRWWDVQCRWGGGITTNNNKGSQQSCMKWRTNWRTAHLTHKSQQAPGLRAWPEPDWVVDCYAVSRVSKLDSLA